MDDELDTLTLADTDVQQATVLIASNQHYEITEVDGRASKTDSENPGYARSSVVGPRVLEPRTSSLSGMRSNRAELWAQ